jgi:hypothetical protein
LSHITPTVAVDRVSNLQERVEAGVVMS